MTGKCHPVSLFTFPFTRGCWWEERMQTSCVIGLRSFSHTSAEISVVSMQQRCSFHTAHCSCVSYNKDSNLLHGSRAIKSSRTRNYFKFQRKTMSMFTCVGSSFGTVSLLTKAELNTSKPVLFCCFLTQ